MKKLSTLPNIVLSRGSQPRHFTISLKNGGSKPKNFLAFFARSPLLRRKAKKEGKEIFGFGIATEGCVEAQVSFVKILRILS